MGYYGARGTAIGKPIEPGGVGCMTCQDGIWFRAGMPKS